MPPGRVFTGGIGSGGGFGLGLLPAALTFLLSAVPLEEVVGVGATGWVEPPTDGAAGVLGCVGWCCGMGSILGVATGCEGCVMAAWLINGGCAEAPFEPKNKSALVKFKVRVNAASLRPKQQFVPSLVFMINPPMGTILVAWYGAVLVVPNPVGFPLSNEGHALGCVILSGRNQVFCIRARTSCSVCVELPLHRSVRFSAEKVAIELEKS
jgi:hypothetical protein